MKKLNNKGFTLVEVLAVVVLLSVLLAIMVPSVNHLIERNKEDNYNELKDSLIQATKVLFSDYRYEVSIDGSCTSNNEVKNIKGVNNYELTDSRVLISMLVYEGNISLNSEGKIVNPKNKNQTLNLNDSYVLVQYQCATKDFSYKIENKVNGEKKDFLSWEQKT